MANAKSGRPGSPRTCLAALYMAALVGLDTTIVSVARSGERRELA